MYAIKASIVPIVLIFTCEHILVSCYNTAMQHIILKILSGEKPYKCTECSHAFAQSNDLKAHMRRHTGERFKCQLCESEFIHKYDLSAHLRNKHAVHVPCSNGRLNKYPQEEQILPN